MSQQLELLTENPSQWASIIHVTHEIQKKQIKPFVALAVGELCGAPDKRLASLVHAAQYAAVRAVVAHLARLRSATRDPWRADDVATFVEGLRFPAECVEELVRLLCTEQVYSALPTHRHLKPTLSHISWKIDISMSECEGAARPGGERGRRALVLLTVACGGGARTYSLTPAKFRELRFTVASALKSMLVLERRHCMRRE